MHDGRQRIRYSLHKDQVNGHCDGDMSFGPTNHVKVQKMQAMIGKHLAGSMAALL